MQRFRTQPRRKYPLAAHRLSIAQWKGSYALSVCIRAWDGRTPAVPPLSYMKGSFSDCTNYCSNAGVIRCAAGMYTVKLRVNNVNGNARAYALSGAEVHISYWKITVDKQPWLYCDRQLVADHGNKAFT